MMSQKPGSPNRQKIISGVIVVILMIVVWQIIGMFTGKKIAKPVTPPPNHTVANKSTPSVVKTSPASPAAIVTANSPMQTPPAHAAVTAQVNPSPVSKDMDFLKAQREMQQQYLDSLNELQMLRIKKEIAETSQAIATAKLATVTAEKNISDVLIQPSPLATPINSAQPSQPQVQAQYLVISVAMQNARWSAVLQHEGKLYSVSVGDVLPIDGSIVISIARDGVVLEKNGEKTKIGMVSAI